jgi:hypothetical protein
MADRLEEAFAATTKILFGKPLQQLDRYSAWLLERIAAIHLAQSAIGSGTAAIPEYSFFGYMPKSRVVSFEQAPTAAQKKISEPADGVSLAQLLPEIKKIAYFVPTFAEGNNLDVTGTACYLDCVNVKKSFDPFDTKHSACVFQTLHAENIFGCYYNINVTFSIHCYNCLNVQRCFEMDTAKNCSDSFFCHNVENLDNCMFCFNTKSKRYAIGNVEVSKEKYLQIKSQLLERILPQLEKNRRLPFDIYDVLAQESPRATFQLPA